MSPEIFLLFFVVFCKSLKLRSVYSTTYNFDISSTIKNGDLLGREKHFLNFSN